MRRELLKLRPDDERAPMVPFVPFRCPYCHRSKPRTYAVRGPIRYHRCLACGEKYRSRELAPKDVEDWLRLNPLPE
jgi:hypothetical protein